ncbi:hypothetical protein KC866_00395 [Patescibacteria group bacterium]|nr:hypothetical protein [Patescibacteria group bacterium]
MTVSNGEEKHMSFNRQEEVQVLRYAIHIQQENIKHDTSKWNTLIDHLFDSFRWSVCGYYNELPRTRDNYRALLLDALSRNPYEELTSIEQKIQKDISLRNELLSALTEEEQKVADIVQQIVYLKDYYKSQCNEFLCKAEPFFERLSEVLGWKIHDLKNLNEDEMVTLLQDKPIDLALVAQRNKQSIPITWNGHFNVLVNEQALLFKETFLNTTSNVPLQYKGRTACRGLVEGIARVVLRKEEFAEFNEREILVAFNTSPDYVPIMKRASAIIAEEGGLTSHTAIVARELNIPCIVGIDHITDFVYTGDRLRVDASNGVIEIVEKHE